MKSLNKEFRKLVFALSIFALLLILGCATTVVPKPVPVPAAASFDGTNQNSGWLGYSDKNKTLGVITPRARERYNSLIGRYGKAWNIGPDFGLSPFGDNYTITPQALVYFEVMSQWKRDAKSQ